MSYDDRNPYAPPRRSIEEASPFRPREVRRPSSTNAWFEDGQVVVPRVDGELPNRCVVCNRHTSYKLRRTLQWIPPVYALLILAGWIIYVIVYFIVRKTAVLDLGLCEEHEKRRKGGLVILWAGVLGSFVFLILGFGANEPLILILALVAMVISLIAGAVQSRVIKLKKIDEQYAYFTAGPEFMRDLPGDPYDPNDEPIVIRKKKKKRPKPAAEAAVQGAKPADESAAGESDDAEEKASSD